MKAATWICTLLGLAALSHRAPAADKADGMEFFEAKVRPILVDKCYSCHSQKSSKVRGGLLLDSRDGVLKGGDTGPALKPGDVEHSLLIKAVRYTDGDLQMPPKNQKLTAAQIAALEAWVKMGAPDPRVALAGAPKAETIRERAKMHWAFQPVHEPAVPAVKHRRLSRTPVDNFLLTQLEAKGLSFSPEADKRTLIRRATFDLIGLPPTPEEVAAFIADKSHDAYARVVDRLLASPRYGERWGRHWLDVARYADTKGYVFEEDIHYAYAYTYRDYVIRAFNADMPYDRFIKEQIAADLLPNGDKQSLAALGYLTVGRRFINNINDIIDDRIDVVCRGLMGLTVGCARCHDHKFDPIPARDYYSLYGVFASSAEPAVKPLLGTGTSGKAYDDYLAERKKREAERESYRQTEEKEMAARVRGQTGEFLLASYEVQHAPNHPTAEQVAHAHKLDPEILNRWIAGLAAWRGSKSDIFGPWFDFAALPEKDFAARAKTVAAQFVHGANLNPAVAKIFSANAPISIKQVADRYGALFAEVDRHWQKICTNAPAPNSLPDAAEETLRQILYADGAPSRIPPGDYDRLFDTPVDQKMRELQRNIDSLEATSPGAPPRAMAMEDLPDPHDAHVFIRGNSGNLGPAVPREFLEFLAGPNRKPFSKGSGRLELAEAIASPANPLTARVLVNRVWLHHFGSPLVSTPGDFGLRSDPPANPQLLDYLAARFMSDGWSIKKLHRLIMLSRAYMQSSDDNARAEKTDANNQLYWRMNRQRLEFEPMRDTMLAVSGKLDLTEGGRSVDITLPETHRRAVYGFVDRQNLPDLLRAFDFASPDTSSPRRFFTTVPQQALFVMNNPFVVVQAESMVERIDFKSAHTDEQRIRLLYHLAYQRDPTREELNWARDYLHASSDDKAAWRNYAQVILMSNELIFVD